MYVANRYPNGARLHHLIMHEVYQNLEAASLKGRKHTTLKVSQQAELSIGKGSQSETDMNSNFT